MLGTLAWIIYGAMATVDGNKKYNYKCDDKQKAIQEGRPWYWDNKGNRYSVKTNQKIVVSDREAYDPVAKRMRHRKCLLNMKGQIIEWFDDYFDYKY